jgi:hypothetical protein
MGLRFVVAAGIGFELGGGVRVDIANSEPRASGAHAAAPTAGATGSLT